MPKEYIERNALLADISETVIFSEKTGQISAEARGANKVISRIKAAPAADVVQVRRGRWDIDEFGHYCTVCKEYAVDEIFETSNGSAFCPNCGAKMDGKDIDT